MRAFIFVLALTLASVAGIPAGAQEGHPLKGSWIGTWAGNKTHGNDVVVVLNWTPIVRRGYRVGVPEAGFYHELLNSDAGLYGGSNIGNAGGLNAEEIRQHGHHYSINLTLPPLGGLVLKRRSS
jgi:1,4-alpha-glucan branching enzyme